MTRSTFNRAVRAVGGVLWQTRRAPFARGEEAQTR